MMSVDMQTPLTLYDICTVCNSKPILMLPLIPYSIYITATLSLKVINSQSLLYFSCQLVVWVEIGNWYFVPVSIRSYNFLPSPSIQCKIKCLQWDVRLQQMFVPHRCIRFSIPHKHSENKKVGEF